MCGTSTLLVTLARQRDVTIGISTRKSAQEFRATTNERRPDSQRKIWKQESFEFFIFSNKSKPTTTSRYSCNPLTRCVNKAGEHRRMQDQTSATERPGAAATSLGVHPFRCWHETPAGNEIQNFSPTVRTIPQQQTTKNEKPFAKDLRHRRAPKKEIAVNHVLKF